MIGCLGRSAAPLLTRALREISASNPTLCRENAGREQVGTMVPYSAAAEHLKAGKLGALAAASERRVDPLPDVPALAEFGFKGIDADLWLAVFAPAKTSKESIS